MYLGDLKQSDQWLSLILLLPEPANPDCASTRVCRDELILTLSTIICVCDGYLPKYIDLNSFIHVVEPLKGIIEVQSPELKFLYLGLEKDCSSMMH